MTVFFYSSDSNQNKISFQTEGKYIENSTLVFEDKTNEKTMIFLSVFDDFLRFKRTGKVEMEFDAKVEKKTEGKYKNDEGLSFDFEVFCKKLQIKKNRIDLEYDMILDKEVLSSHKIWIIIR